MNMHDILEVPDEPLSEQALVTRDRFGKKQPLPLNKPRAVRAR